MTLVCGALVFQMIRIFGYGGVGAYLEENMNKFDCLITTFSFFSILVNIKTGPFSILRMLRLFRILMASRYEGKG